MNLRSHLLALSLIVIAPAAALAQGVAIYNLEFDEVGHTINYRSYDSGFLVVPSDGGDGDLLLLLDTGSGLQYVQASGAATWFVATDGTDQKAVVANADAAGTPVQFFTIIGDVDTTLRFNTSTTDDAGTTTSTNVSRRVASELEGHVLTADGATASLFDANAGSAGASEVYAKLDNTRTTTANRTELTIAEVVAEIIVDIERVGVTEYGLSLDSDDDAADAGAAANGN